MNNKDIYTWSSAAFCFLLLLLSVSANELWSFLFWGLDWVTLLLLLSLRNRTRTAKFWPKKRKRTKCKTSWQKTATTTRTSAAAAAATNKHFLGCCANYAKRRQMRKIWKMPPATMAKTAAAAATTVVRPPPLLLSPATPCWATPTLDWRHWKTIELETKKNGLLKKRTRFTILLSAHELKLHIVRGRGKRRGECTGGGVP